MLLGTDRIGKGDDTLGRKLVVSFIGILKKMRPEPWRLILLNGGVKLTVEGSECLPPLQALEKEGIRIPVCGTCLNHFGLIEKKQVGESTNMLDIVTVTAMQRRREGHKCDVARESWEQWMTRHLVDPAKRFVRLVERQRWVGGTRRIFLKVCLRRKIPILPWGEKHPMMQVSTAFRMIRHRFKPLISSRRL
ncbi:MAG: sulfurtransferase-like selenium metabolism protein YedF [Syntrophobacteraceae bacterium]|nr:sulfurtransferase-like selenium metabolism protein YedF [Syntrophobacteraceae bacterium]